MSTSKTHWLQRSKILLGQAAIENLQHSHVLLAGAGGVGGYAAEALARSGLGALTVFDPDKVHITNLNRQILALHSTLDEYKTGVLRQRLLDINPDIRVNACAEALTANNIEKILQDNCFDYIVDAIDSVNDKCCLLATAHRMQIPVISAMGAGRRLDPTALQYADISKTYNCKLAKVVRSKLKKEYDIVKGIECVFSSEPSLPPADNSTPEDNSIIGSCSWLPGISGLYPAARVIQVLGKKNCCKTV